nr:hypothetical protein [Paraeggerthella hongkongensis]
MIRIAAQAHGRTLFPIGWLLRGEQFFGGCFERVGYLYNDREPRIGKSVFYLVEKRASYAQHEGERVLVYLGFKAQALDVFGQNVRKPLFVKLLMKRVIMFQA